MAVACGSAHTLTVDDEGRLWAFGRNITGQCGSKTNGEDVIQPTRVEGVADIISIAAGYGHSACVDIGGHVWMFGDNCRGQLCIENIYDIVSTPTRVLGLDNIISVACGNFYTLCLTKNGTVYVFGSNEYGQLGIGSTLESHTPISVHIKQEIKQIACGAAHSLLLMRSGDVWVSGDNSCGQLGMGDNEDRFAFIKNPYLADIVKIDCCNEHTIVMNSERKLFSFGSNYEGRLALYDEENRNKPECIDFADGEIQSFACGTYHTCILDTSKRVWLFGMDMIKGDRSDQFAYGMMLDEPVDVCCLSKGGNHVLLKCLSNEIWAFGTNNHNQLLICQGKSHKT